MIIDDRFDSRVCAAVGIHFFRQADKDENGILQGDEVEASEGLHDDHSKRTFKEFIEDIEKKHPQWNPRGEDNPGFGGELGWQDYQHAVWLNCECLSKCTMLVPSQHCRLYA